MTLTWDKNIEVGGTSLRGYFDSIYSFQETVARLITLSGQEAMSPDGYKVWNLLGDSMVKSSRFTTTKAGCESTSEVISG